MRINGKKIICQVDSGASVNVISAKHLENPTINDRHTTLNVYSGDALKTLGKTNLELVNPKTDESITAEFLVVKEDLITLIGKSTSDEPYHCKL